MSAKITKKEKKARENLRDLILEKEKENKVVYSTFEGYACNDLDEIIDLQPVDGLLYDLNRLPEVVLTWIDDQKWVNDYAVQLVIKRLHERMTKAERRVKELDG